MYLIKWKVSTLSLFSPSWCLQQDVNDNEHDKGDCDDGGGNDDNNNDGGNDGDDDNDDDDYDGDEDKNVNHVVGSKVSLFTFHSSP